MRLLNRAHPATNTIPAIVMGRRTSLRTIGPFIDVFDEVLDEVVLEGVVVGSGTFQPDNFVISHQKARPFCSQLEYVV